MNDNSMFFKKDNPKVEFFTQYEPLLETPELHPQPASKFFPEWFKQISSEKKQSIADDVRISGTIRDCPVFAEYLTQGYVIPLWCDTIIYCSSNGEWKVNTPISDYKWEHHSPAQFSNFIPEIENKSNYTTLKAVCPWHVKTSKNYSLYQMEMFYHYNQDFKILPGSIKTDSWADINQQVLIMHKDKEIFIPRGTPFAWYIPFKRQKYDFIVSGMNEDNRKHLNSAIGAMNSKFVGGYKMLTKRFTNQR